MLRSLCQDSRLKSGLGFGVSGEGLRVRGVLGGSWGFLRGSWGLGREKLAFIQAKSKFFFSTYILNEQGSWGSVRGGVGGVRALQA